MLKNVIELDHMLNRVYGPQSATTMILSQDGYRFYFKPNNCLIMIF